LVAAQPNKKKKSNPVLQTGNKLASLNFASNSGLSSLSLSPSVVFITHYLRYDCLLNSSSDAYLFNNLFAIELRFLKRGMMIPILQGVDNWSNASTIAMFQVVSTSPLSCQLLTEDNRFPLLASVGDDIFKIFVLNELGVARLPSDFITISSFINIIPLFGSYDSISEFSSSSSSSRVHLRAFPSASSSKQKDDLVPLFRLLGENNSKIRDLFGDYPDFHNVHFKSTIQLKLPENALHLVGCSADNLIELLKFNFLISPPTSFHNAKCFYYY